MKNKTLLDPRNALRIETWNNNRKLYVFKCLTEGCSNEIRVGIAPSQLSRSTGHCTSCNRKGKPYGTLFARLEANAKKKQVKLDLSYEEFLDFTKVKRCTYCQSEIDWKEHGKSGENTVAYNLDRMDSSKGYSKENCVVCCKICNWSKNDLFSHEEFLIVGKAIGEVLRSRGHSSESD